MATSPMSPNELAGWTAQQSARHERNFTPARAARTPDRARCTSCGGAMGLERVAGRPSGAGADAAVLLGAA